MFMEKINKPATRNPIKAGFDFDLGDAKRRMFVKVSLIRGETPLIGETLRKGFYVAGRCGVSPQGG